MTAFRVRGELAPPGLGRCLHTHQGEAFVCTGCVRALFGAIGVAIEEARDDPDLSLGLAARAVAECDRLLAGFAATEQQKRAERKAWGGWTSDELGRLRVAGYSVKELVSMVGVVKAHGLEHEVVRDGSAEAKANERKWFQWGEG